MDMNKLLTLLTLIFVSGCAAKREEPVPSLSDKGILVEIDGWLSARERAEATKTHATGEHPAAQAEMDRREAALKGMLQKDEGAVQSVFSTYPSRLDREKEEIVQRMNRTQIVGRSLTPDEMKFLEETGPRQLEEIEVRRSGVKDLMLRIQ